MKDTELYEQLLGLTEPWSVKQVELSIENNRVTVEVELKRGIIWSDPEVEGGRAWYTALGHKKEHYSDPILTKHILGGILWAMGETK